MAVVRPDLAGAAFEGNQGNLKIEDSGSLDLQVGGELRKTLHEPVTGIQYLRAGVAQRGQEEDDGGSSFGGSQYTKARAVREHYTARLAKLEFEERTGKLVPKDEVQVAAFNKFRQFRDHMLNIPDRVAAMVAAESDAARCYEIIAIEIRKALNEFADSNG